MTNYMPAVDVAKLARKELKQAYPDTKFSVRVSNHKTLHIEWTDGPPTQTIRDLTDQYAGEGFDGMQDLRYSRGHGTEIDGVRYEYLTDFVFCTRNISEDVRATLMTQLANGIAEENGIEPHQVITDQHRFWPTPQFYMREIDHGPWELSIYQMVAHLAESAAQKAFQK